MPRLGGLSTALPMGCTAGAGGHAGHMHMPTCACMGSGTSMGGCNGLKRYSCAWDQALHGCGCGCAYCLWAPRMAMRNAGTEGTPHLGSFAQARQTTCSGLTSARHASVDASRLADWQARFGGRGEVRTRRGACH